MILAKQARFCLLIARSNARLLSGASKGKPSNSDQFPQITDSRLEGDLKKFMHGRGNRERRDSVTNAILLERQQHVMRIKRLPIEANIYNALVAEGLGDKRRRHQVYAPAKTFLHRDGSVENGPNRKTNSGAGGYAVHLTSATRDWPVFKHMLPEIAFAGHSNSGKSTLVNAMVGVQPSKGPAKISERAGWTDQICFFQLGKKPPILTLADMPGYGHAVASAAQRRAWGLMMRDYLENRPVISRCCVLVDCTRGLCRQDKMLVRFLQKKGIPWLIVLTKGDLLDCRALAQSVLAVQLDLAHIVTGRGAGGDSSQGDAGLSENNHPQQVQDERDTEQGAGDLHAGSGNADEDRLSAPHSEDSTSDDSSSDSDSHSHSDSDSDSTSQSDSDSGEKDPAKSAFNEWYNSFDNDDDTPKEKVDIPGRHQVPVVVVSASTGAGVQQLWRRLCEYARADAPVPRTQSGAPPPPTAVREHRLASLVRQRQTQASAARGRTGQSAGERFGAARKLPPVRLGTNRRSVREREREAASEFAEN